MSKAFLLNDFYEIASLQKGENTLSAIIRLNVTHDIFKGHFEQMPVVPGVCQTQIIKELLQEDTGLNLTMTHGDNIKFTGMIVPAEHPEFMVEIQYKKSDDGLVADAKLFHETITFTKFKGTFKIN